MKVNELIIILSALTDEQKEMPLVMYSAEHICYESVEVIQLVSVINGEPYCFLDKCHNGKRMGKQKSFSVIELLSD